MVIAQVDGAVQQGDPRHRLGGHHRPSSATCSQGRSG
jgi:hypothetical protein